MRLAAAIGWAVFSITGLLALIAATLAANAAERRVRADAEQLLTQFAAQLHHTVAMSLEIRRSIVQATAAQMAASNDRGADALRRHLEAVKAQFPEFAWLGLADTQGRVVAATGAAQQGESVAARPWFQQGRSHNYIGEVLGISLADETTPLHFVDMATPLTNSAGANDGVLGAQLSWEWIRKLQTNLLRGLDTNRQLELVLADGRGTVLVGPPGWLGRKLADVGNLTQGGTRVIGLHGDNGTGTGLRWTVGVSQEAGLALAPARSTRQTVFFVVLLAGLASAVAAVVATRMLTRRLVVLAEEVRAVQRGARRNLSVPAGNDEVSRIGAALSDAIDQFQHEKSALARLNTELDARVARRTARIERLAEESRHAAVTRERLRLARELHDTLAHSLMAVLTQVRLVRKLQGRVVPQEFDAELERAENVATTGLAEARAAITQMRHSCVRDTGLGLALQDLLARFGERTGLEAALQADPAVAGLADERAETVFRIAEEALHNIERHAQARNVHVSIGRGRPALCEDPSGGVRMRLEIADDGVGFDTAVECPGHYGLRGIREQAALIGAQLVLQSENGRGTRLVLEFDA